MDGDGLNNTFSNLREATPYQNSQNMRTAPKNYRSGLLGASYHKRSGKWEAQIRSKGKKSHIGLYATPEEAHAAYLSAKRILHPFCTV